MEDAMRVPGYSKSLARQMAQDIVDIAEELGADAQVLEGHLIQRGWSPAEIKAHNVAARALAARTLNQVERAA